MSTSDIGTAIAIATGLPATFTEAGYEAMTWTTIAGVISVSEVGDEDKLITIEDLTTGRSRDVKGAKAGKAVSVAIREVVGDAGLTALKSAAASSAEYSFRISEPTQPAGAEYYISGPITSLMRNERSTSSFAGYKFDVSNNYGAVSGT